MSNKYINHSKIQQISHTKRKYDNIYDSKEEVNCTQLSQENILARKYFGNTVYKRTRAKNIS